MPTFWLVFIGLHGAKLKVQNATEKGVSGTGSLRIGANFLVSIYSSHCDIEQGSRLFSECHSTRCFWLVFIGLHGAKLKAQNATEQGVSGTGSLRIGANFLVSINWLTWSKTQGSECYRKRCFWNRLFRKRCQLSA